MRYLISHNLLQIVTVEVEQFTVLVDQVAVEHHRVFEEEPFAFGFGKDIRKPLREFLVMRVAYYLLKIESP
jgi:hypothetical protein